MFQRAIKSRKFYKGEETKESEAIEFLPEYPNDQSSKKNATNDEASTKTTAVNSTWKHFKSPHAKKAFFVSFASMNIGFFCGIWFMATYVTDIFDKTGSTFSPKNSSLLISIVTLFTNLVFLNIVERFNRKV